VKNHVTVFDRNQFQLYPRQELNLQPLGYDPDAEQRRLAGLYPHPRRQSLVTEFGFDQPAKTEIGFRRSVLAWQGQATGVQ
jgi:hypothetical protein